MTREGVLTARWYSRAWRRATRIAEEGRPLNNYAGDLYAGVFAGYVRALAAWSAAGRPGALPVEWILSERGRDPHEET